MIFQMNWVGVQIPLTTSVVGSYWSAVAAYLQFAKETSGFDNWWIVEIQTELENSVFWVGNLEAEIENLTCDSRKTELLDRQTTIPW
jgi:hypothetical protein